ncbi:MULTISPECIES: GNAT family N-acetyltransferase [unclassified Frigoribacterium]|uniref:GNAT family N-acetyltransferase n=1 Tax=unclassified Frigoribacterium TaxID=2627005 RepID=UPI000AC2F5C1|nr:MULTISPECIES: GNAT family N-acetyltransferase [unclassified Frigoribacterium]
MTTPAPATSIEPRPYDHPDVQQLVEGLQELYVEIYGGRDDSPIDRSEFELPRGTFAVAYEAGEPVALGAWRLLPDGRAELKRMYVRPDRRGHGLSRLVLHWLERSAAHAGVTEMVIETNVAHDTAIRLYESAGYRPIAPYGHYADDEGTVSLGRTLVDETAGGTA